MFSEFDYFPVNWKDGMQVSSKDFAAEQNAIQDNFRDIRMSLLNEYSYGLFPCNENPEPHLYPGFEIEANEQEVKVYLKECKAVTVGGYRIEWTSRMVQKLNIPKSKYPFVKLRNIDGEYYLVLSVDPYKPSSNGNDLVTQVGEDSQSGFPRKLNTIAHYEMHVLQEGQWDLSPNRVVIGKLLIKNKKPTIDESSFIPACTSVNSHSELQKIYEHELCKRIDAILDNCIKVLRQTKVRIANDPPVHAYNAYLVADKLAFFLESVYSQIKISALYQPPIYMISICLNLAKTLQLCFRLVRNEQTFFDNYLKDCIDKGHTMRDILAVLLSNTIVEERADIQHSDILLVPNQANIKPALDLVCSFLRILEQFTRNLVGREFLKEDEHAW